MKFAVKLKGKSLPKGPITVHIKQEGQGEPAQPTYEKSKKTFLFSGRKKRNG